MQERVSMGSSLLVIRGCDQNPSQSRIRQITRTSVATQGHRLFNG